MCSSDPSLRSRAGLARCRAVPPAMRSEGVDAAECLTRRLWLRLSFSSCGNAASLSHRVTCRTIGLSARSAANVFAQRDLVARDVKLSERGEFVELLDDTDAPMLLPDMESK